MRGFQYLCCQASKYIAVFVGPLGVHEHAYGLPTMLLHGSYGALQRLLPSCLHQGITLAYLRVQEPRLSVNGRIGKTTLVAHPGSVDVVVAPRFQAIYPAVM